MPDVPKRELGLPVEANGQTSLPFKLTGSQAKTAFALRQNVEAMLRGNARGTIARYFDSKLGREVVQYVATNADNLNRAGFLTLTVGDETPDGFKQVFDAAEASRRINNLNRRVLADIFERWICVTERHKNKAVHFHIVGVLRSRADIRTGFDFAALRKASEARQRGRVNKAAEIRYKLAASEELRALWATLRERLPEYGFGRAQLTPIEKTGEAIACYVSKYIEKNLCNRLKEDRRKKLVRYLGWAHAATPEEQADASLRTKLGNPPRRVSEHLKPNRFSWGSKRACAWRGKARDTASLLNIHCREDCAKVFGPRWAMRLSRTWQGRTPDDLMPFLVCDYAMRRLLANDLAKEARQHAPDVLREIETPMVPFLTSQEARELIGRDVGEVWREPAREALPDYDEELAESVAGLMEVWRELNRKN